MELANEVQYLTLTEAADLFPGKPHECTVRRYAKTGLKGKTLRVVRSAGKLWTTAEDVRDFIAATNERATEQTPSRNRRLIEARRRLREQGIETRNNAAGAQ